jgi:hypothetical protein
MDVKDADAKPAAPSASMEGERKHCRLHTEQHLSIRLFAFHSALRHLQLFNARIPFDLFHSFLSVTSHPTGGDRSASTAKSRALLS